MRSLVPAFIRNGVDARRRTGLVVGGGTALVLTVGVLGALNLADAATPTDGTLSATSTSVSWVGGPFTVPNQSGNLGEPTCDVADPCDDFTLGLNVPATYQGDHQLKISVSWPDTTSDFDVYLKNSAGSTVASAASSADPEVVMAAPAPGNYTVRVVPFLPLGDSYAATATLVPSAGDGGGGGGTGPGTPSTETAPGLTNYAAPASVGTDVDNAGEPSIGNNFNTGATLYQASLSTYKVGFDNATSPATATWSNVSATVANGCAAGGTTSLDPILFTDKDTGRTFESQLTGVNSATCYTDDDGVSWSPSTGGGIPSGVDHQTIGGGPYNPAAVGPLPTSAYANSVYYCSQDIATAFCAASNDGGTTFGAGVPTYNLSQCVGLHGHIKVAPDGTAYLPNKSCTDADGVARAAVAVTKDGGLSYTVNTVPTSSAGESDPSVGISRNGTVYLGYIGADGKPGVATSTDQGTTWKYGQTVGTEFAIKNAVFPEVVAGDDDRAAFAYLGTPTGGNAGETGVFPGVWHLYVDYTYDGGKTWVTSDATPTDPVQRGSICTAGTTCGADRNLLDFMDIGIDDHGRVLVGYADGCIAACATDPTVLTHDAYSTIARQSSGKTLYAKYDAPTASPTATATPTATTSPSTTPTTSPSVTSTTTSLPSITVTTTPLPTDSSSSSVSPTTTTSSSVTPSTTSSPTTTTSSPTATATTSAPPKVKRTNLRLVKVTVKRVNGMFYTRMYIKNTGNTFIRKFTSAAYDEGRLRGRGRVGGSSLSVRPGQTVVRYVHWTYNPGIQVHRLRFVADKINYFDETSETDNTIRRTVKLPPR